MGMTEWKKIFIANEVTVVTTHVPRMKWGILAMTAIFNEI